MRVDDIDLLVLVLIQIFIEISYVFYPVYRGKILNLQELSRDTSGKQEVSQSIRGDIKGSTVFENTIEKLQGVRKLCTVPDMRQLGDYSHLAPDLFVPVGFLIEKIRYIFLAEASAASLLHSGLNKCSIVVQLSPVTN